MPWRGPQFDGDFPSLGWDLLDWFEQFPSPRDPSEPLRFTDAQARSIIDWYRIDEHGKRIYRRGFSRRSKGYGKSPVEAAKAIGEFAGPVRFDGWNADGDPVGRPWGGAGDPPPWVQVGAVSLDQTDNTWSVVWFFLTENDAQLAQELGIDPGLTRCYLLGRPGAKMEPVTAASGSREGQPITYAVLDETHLWFKSNKGDVLARTLRRNVAKVGGTSFETTNSFVIGEDSVAEGSFNAAKAGTAGVYADEVEAPRKIGKRPVNADASASTIRSALKVAYGDSWWVDVDRHIDELRDPATEWLEWARFFLNWNTPANANEDGPISVARWSQLVDGESMAVDDSISLGLSAPLGRPSAVFVISGRREDHLRHASIRHWIPGHKLTELVEVAKKLTDGHRVALKIPAKDPALAWADDLKEAGVEFEVVKMTQVVEAQQAIEQDVAGGTIRHRGQPEMMTAVRGLAARVSGDSSSWSRRSSSSNIAPLMALAAARAGGEDDSADYYDAHDLEFA